MEHKSKSIIASARGKSFHFNARINMIVKIFHPVSPFYINPGNRRGSFFFYDANAYGAFYSSFMKLVLCTQ